MLKVYDVEAPKESYNTTRIIYFYLTKSCFVG